MPRRVVVTGLGVICSIGENVRDFWDNCLLARAPVSSVPESWLRSGSYHSRIWSPLPAYDFTSPELTRIEQTQLDPAGVLSIKAGFQALENARFTVRLRNEKRNTYTVDGLDPGRAGVFLGTGVGGVSTLSQCHAFRILEHPRRVLEELAAREREEDARKLKEIAGEMILPVRFNPYAVSMVMPNACAAQVGIKLGLKGANVSLNAACASGTVAVGHGFRAVRDGYLDLAVTGGAEYIHDEYGSLFYAFDVLRTLAHKYDAPETANRPFDRDRSGFLFSQGGAAVLVLEEYAQALERGAPVLAEITGFAETSDAHNIITMDPEGGEIRRMFREALQEAGCPGEEVDYINAHGTGTELNDEVESAVIAELFSHRPLVNSTKSLVGHTLGASGAIEAAVTALSLRHGTTHICKNLVNPLRELNFVREVKPHPLRTAVTQSFGFGGHNACLVMSRPA